MDVPQTRSRGKKHGQAGSPTLSATHLRRIHASHNITKDDVAQLYHINKPVCQGCRVNTKDNPNCFCCFVPPPNGVRKQGLWQKMADTLSELGPDPGEALRQTQESPSGLTNLGATCYVNSVLQCLYMTRAFRTGVFAAEMDLVKQQPVLYQLGLLFAQLHSGKRIAVDSAPFASTLELDNAVQQDGQEFLKLLLTLLERVLGASKSLLARNVVQNVFRGTFSYVIKCFKCGQESDASKTAVDFYELELNVKGFSSLEESLNDYLSEEILQGENQWFCRSCQMRVDATHCTKLRSLPPVLNFQLKRFVFNTKTSTKKKVTSKFSFPRTIDMGPRLSAPPVLGEDKRGTVYDLSAILVHKGSMVNSGHYVAHIKDDRTNGWWQFDDEQVSSLGFHPLGEVVAQATVTKDLAVREGKGDPMMVELLLIGELWLWDLRADIATGEPNLQASLRESWPTDVSPKSTSVAFTNESDMLTSADAYMLMYTRRTEAGIWGGTNPGSLLSAALGGPSPIEVEKEPGDEKSSSLPEQLRVEIEVMNKEFESMCWEYRRRREEELTKIADRKKEVRAVLCLAPAKSVEEPFFWISTEWLRSWADSLRPPPPIDNAHLICQHQKVPPKKIPQMKRISSRAWKQLETMYKGGPALNGGDYCNACIYEDAKAAASADSYRDQRTYMREVIDEVLAGRGLEGNSFFVSRTWLLQWVRRKVTDAPSDADAGPTAALRCPHGGLLPEQAAGAKRQLVPEPVWDYFVQNAEQVETAEAWGHEPFRGDQSTCMQCQVEINKTASKKEGLRATKIEQRAKHESLYSGKQVLIYPGCKYHLVPSVWLSKWRSYLGASGKNVLAVDEPVGLEGFILSLLCQKHEGMLFKPPDLSRTRRGDLIQRMSSEDVFTIVTEDDWLSLCQQWEMDPKKGIQAMVDISADTSKGVITEGDEECSSHLEELSGPDPCNGSKSDVYEMSAINHLEFGTPPDENSFKAENVPVLRTQPEVCRECIEERETHEFLTKLNYTNREITVDLVRGKDPPPSLLVASSGFEVERRTSKRARRASATSGGRILVNVSGDTTVFQLKLQIWESLAVVRENQKLHFGKVELVDDDATLADLNILPGAHLWVMDTGQHENRDIAEELPAEESGRIETEEGFRGTRLLMGLPGLVESFTAHAVQSGVVSPNPWTSNGMDSTLAHVLSSGNLNVEPTSFHERSAGQQSMETEPGKQTEAAGERTGSTSGEVSADSHLSMAEMFTAPQGSDPSATGDVTSAEQLEDSDMGTVAEEEGDAICGKEGDQGSLGPPSEGLHNLVEFRSDHTIQSTAFLPGCSFRSGNEARETFQEFCSPETSTPSVLVKDGPDFEVTKLGVAVERNTVDESLMELDSSIAFEVREVEALSQSQRKYDVGMEGVSEGGKADLRTKDRSDTNYRSGAQQQPIALN